MEIRRTSLKFSSSKKRERLAEQRLLMHDIEILENSVDYLDGNNNTIAELSKKRLALEQLIDYETQGAFIRSRAKYAIDGEKPTKLFCALEANNSIQKYVPQLIIQRDSVESTISDQKDVETEIHRFYKDLFECKVKYRSSK